MDTVWNRIARLEFALEFHKSTATGCKDGIPWGIRVSNMEHGRSVAFNTCKRLRWSLLVYGWEDGSNEQCNDTLTQSQMEIWLVGMGLAFAGLVFFCLVRAEEQNSAHPKSHAWSESKSSTFFEIQLLFVWLIFNISCCPDTLLQMRIDISPKLPHIPLEARLY